MPADGLHALGKVTNARIEVLSSMHWLTRAL